MLMLIYFYSSIYNTPITQQCGLREWQHSVTQQALKLAYSLAGNNIIQTREIKSISFLEALH